MAEKIGVTVDCAQQMVEIAKHVQELFEKYGDHTCFEYCCGIDSEKDRQPYAKWRLYTSILGYEEFETSEALITFVRKILKDSSLYFGKKMKRLEESKQLYLYDIRKIEASMRALKKREERDKV